MTETSARCWLRFTWPINTVFNRFTSIAGTGAIVDPAVAIFWGCVPALLAVFLNSIIMGAVHDFGASIISLTQIAPQAFTRWKTGSRAKLIIRTKE